MQEKQRPVGVGFFFSLGHSTVVVCLTILVAIATVAVSNFKALAFHRVRQNESAMARNGHAALVLPRRSRARKGSDMTQLICHAG